MKPMHWQLCCSSQLPAQRSRLGQKLLSLCCCLAYSMSASKSKDQNPLCSCQTFLAYLGPFCPGLSWVLVV